MLRLFLLGVALLLNAPSHAQTSQGTRNVRLLAHVPLLGHGPARAVSFDQNASLAYVAHPNAISVVDTEQGRKIDGWASPDGTVDVAVTPEFVLTASDSGVTFRNRSDGTSATRAVGPVRSVFPYRHSSGRILVLAASPAGALLVEGETVHTISLPEDVPNRQAGGHGVYAAYDLATETDRLYLAGGGGYFVFDITNHRAPALLTWINSAAVQTGVAIQATPDASHVVTSTHYASAPIRLFDLRPALDGTVSQVRTAAGAWTADWRGHPEQFQVRWPYVFVAAGANGFHMFNMRNAFEPYTTASFSVDRAVDVDVRNRDGVIAVADAATGLWLIRAEDFTGWDGRGWGVGNISAVQDWDQGPVRADRW